MLFTLQQDCNTRKACRLFIVVKVVQVVFHYKQELLSPRRFHFMVPFLAMAKFELCLSMAYRKSCIMLFTLQQDCNTRVACRLLFVVKVVVCCKGCSSCFSLLSRKTYSLFSLLCRPLFHPHCISSHIIARVRTAAHPIAQRGRREAITLHSETLTARREIKNPSRQGRAEGGRASQSNPKPSRRPSEAKATPSTPLQPSPKAKAKREGTRAGTADEQRPTGRRLTSEG